MPPKQSLRSHWFAVTTVLFSAAVFSYWLFLRPYVMLAREQSLLFLWNREYLLERIVVPGGLAQYLSEFLVQFFVHPVYGALIHALLFASGLCLMRSLTKHLKASFLISFLFSVFLWWLTTNIYIPLTPIVAVLLTLCVMRFATGWLRLVLIPVLYWLVGPAAVLLLLPDGRKRKPSLPLILSSALLFAVCLLGSSWLTPYPLRQVARGIDYYWEDHNMGTLEEMRFDMLMRQRNWSAVEKATPPNLQSSASISQSLAFIMSEMFMQKGMVSMAQRAAFEAMECIPNHNKSARSLQRLIETNLVQGHYDVARKYLNLLSQTTFYRSWASQMRPLADHPERIPTHISLGPLRKAYEKTPDTFFY